MPPSLFSERIVCAVLLGPDGDAWLHPSSARAARQSESPPRPHALARSPSVIRVRDFTVKTESGFVFTQCVKFTVKAKCVKYPTLTA